MAPDGRLIEIDETVEQHIQTLLSEARASKPSPLELTRSFVEAIERHAGMRLHERTVIQLYRSISEARRRRRRDVLDDEAECSAIRRILVSWPAYPQTPESIRSR